MARDGVRYGFAHDDGFECHDLHRPLLSDQALSEAWRNIRKPSSRSSSSRIDDLLSSHAVAGKPFPHRNGQALTRGLPAFLIAQPTLRLIRDTRTHQSLFARSERNKPSRCEIPSDFAGGVARRRCWSDEMLPPTPSRDARVFDF